MNYESVRMDSLVWDQEPAIGAPSEPSQARFQRRFKATGAIAWTTHLPGKRTPDHRRANMAHIKQSELVKERE